MRKIRNGIYQLDSGKYWVRVRRRGHSLSETFTTLKQAEAWKQAEERRLENVRAKLPAETNEKIKIADLVLEWATEEGQHHKGWNQERLILKNFPEAITRLEIKRLDERTIQKWIDALIKADLRPSTIQKRVKLLNRVINFGIKKHIDLRGIDNPIKNNAIKIPRIGKEDKRDRTASDQEIKALQKQIGKKSRNINAYILLAIETTARRGDLYKLRYEQINWEKETVKFLDGKTGDRTAPLSPLALSILKKRQKEIGSAWVFPNAKKTKHIKADSLSQAFIRIRNKASIELPSVSTLRLHDLRHTGATKWADSMNIFELQQITGHKTLAMLNRYVNKEAEDVAAKMRRLTNNKPPKI
jgi:integrase